MSNRLLSTVLYQEMMYLLLSIIANNIKCDIYNDAIPYIIIRVHSARQTSPLNFFKKSRLHQTSDVTD